MEIEVSAFGNFLTDTGSMNCNQVNINVFRFRRSRPSVPHGANFFIILFTISPNLQKMKFQTFYMKNMCYMVSACLFLNLKNYYFTEIQEIKCQLTCVRCVWDGFSH